MRKLIESDLVGKTIKSFDASCGNMLKLTFTDETTLELCADGEVYTEYGIIPGIFVEDISYGNA